MTQTLLELTKDISNPQVFLRETEPLLESLKGKEYHALKAARNACYLATNTDPDHRRRNLRGVMVEALKA